MFLLGIGRNNLVKVPLDKSCRMDVAELEKMLEHCLENRIPVIGVTVVFGTTQEGAVDNLDQVKVTIVIGTTQEGAVDNLDQVGDTVVFGTTQEGAVDNLDQMALQLSLVLLRRVL